MIKKDQCLWVHETTIGLLLIASLDHHKELVTHICKKLTLRNDNFAVPPVFHSISKSDTAIISQLTVHDEDILVLLVEFLKVRNEGVQLQALPVDTAEIRHILLHILQNFDFVVLEIMNEVNNVLLLDQ